MKRKALKLLSLCAVIIFLLTACGNSTTGKNTASSGRPTADSPNIEAEGIGKNTSNTSFSENSQDAQTDPDDQKGAEGYDILGGQLWEVSGVLVRNKVVDIHDNKDLESFYRATYLSFGSDGRFIYLDTIPKGGTYAPYETDDEYDCFLLKTDTIYQYDADKNKLVEIESGTKKPYIIYILDDNTFEFVEFDPMTGKAKANEIPLFFAKSHEESPYIQDHKTEIAQSSGNSANSTGSSGSGTNSAGSSGSGTNSAGSSGNGANSAGSSTDRDTNLGNKNRSSTVGDSSSYQSILDTYTEKMEKAVPGLVSQYRSEASGVTDIGKLAEICNNKIGKLAGICNEGVGKMAELMNSRGDSYSTYEGWAGKLMDNYSDIAQEIQDAYLDSAMY